MSVPTSIRIRSLRPSVQETSPDGNPGKLSVAYIQLTGADGNTRLSLSGADAARFQLVKSNNGAYLLELKAGSAVDFEQQKSLNVQITASSVAASGSLSENYLLAVTDVNEAPTFTGTAAVTIAENTVAVGTFTAKDVDAGDALTYSLSGRDAALLVIDPSTGSVQFKSAPDFESQKTFLFNVVATDKGGLTAVRSITVQVTGVNEAPTTEPVTLEPLAGGSGDRIITQAQLLSKANDPEDDLLTVEGLAIKAGSGTLSSIGNGTWRFTPAAGDASEVTFSYLIKDNGSTNSVADPKSTAGTAQLDIKPTLISQIQGTGDTSPLNGQTVTIQGRVTAWKPGLNLFFVQEETADRDQNAQTSEGIAVFYGNNNPGISADSIGDIVQITGRVSEFKATSDSGTGTLTQLTAISGFSVITDGTTADLDPPTMVKLPIASGTTLEAFEGMLIEVSAASGQGLFVADTFTFARFGETVLHADGVPFQFTEHEVPSAQGYASHQDFLVRNSIQLEDGSTAQNPSLSALNSGTMITRDTTLDGVSNGTTLGVQADGSVSFIRAGDKTSSVTGVLSYGFGSYELQPTQTVTLTASPRPSGVPELGPADIKVASFNVLNYFTTLGTGSFTNPSGVTHQGRGATTPAEFSQQQAKIVAAMLATGAHAFGINELQNNGDGASSAIASLVDALNFAAGQNRFSFIKGHATGSDAIRVGIVYDSGVLVPAGKAVTPDVSTYTIFASANRLPLAQTFAYAQDPTKSFTLVVNHFKSKGSAAGLPGDSDQGDGQGASNATRVEASKQLAAWLSTNPTKSPTDNLVLVGDLNAYRMEDPVRELESQGFSHQGKSNDYSYMFDGQRGSLDHVLTRGLTTDEVTGVVHLNLNSDEQIALDYNDEFGDGSVSRDLDRADAFRSSDHDPVIIGLRLVAGAPVQPVDETPPAAPALALQPASDSGDSNADGISRIATPVLKVTLQGTGAAAPVAGDVLRVFSGTTQIASSTIASSDIGAGFVDITTSSLGADGAKTLTARVEDAAGNISNPSNTVTYSLDTTAPALSSAATSADGGGISLVYDSSLSQLNAPVAAAFVVKVDGSAAALASTDPVSISGNTLTLRLGAPIQSGSSVTLSYADPTTGDDAKAIQDAAGNDASSLFERSVTNQVAVTPKKVTYTENFNTLAVSGTSSTVPNGWSFSETGSNQNGTYNAGTGSNNTGDTYSFGSSGSTDRAFGGLQSGSLASTLSASFVNTTGQTVVEAEIKYTGEQWRLGALGREDRLDFQYSTDGGNTWINFDSLDFIAPVTSGSIGAVNGNLASNSKVLSGVITGLSLSAGAVLQVRWLDFNPSGADDGLAIDDVSVTLVGIVPTGP